jgi:hypothetical protein
MNGKFATRERHTSNTHWILRRAARNEWRQSRLIAAHACGRYPRRVCVLRCYVGNPPNTAGISDSLSCSGYAVKLSFMISHNDGPRSECFDKPDQFGGTMGNGRCCKGAWAKSVTTPCSTASPSQLQFWCDCSNSIEERKLKREIQ